MNNISARVEQLSSSQRLLLALDEAVGKLEAVERSKTEPIAIIGMSCRFPGGANDPETFWQLLINGVDAITEVPPERWNVAAHYDPNPDTPGKMYTRQGGFLEQVDQFDCEFFGISPREAVRVDPQQRLLLETAWEALENAGLIPNKQAVNQTGVFVGITTNDYARLLTPKSDFSQIDAYYLTGNPLNAVAGRLSYTLGLQGPCMAIDTACSSSLVAVHLACQSLRNGECQNALAGGVNLILSPENTIALSKAKMMAPNGRCKTFDAEADGIVRGEGCGILVLKRLSDAVTDGDNILALIRGSAVNQDGNSSGFTVPNKAAQEVLIRQALTRAKVKPSEVDYVEAHGTGTPLGDPIEVRALGAVLGEGRSSELPLKIGSVKTNIGHLESASGVASLIKVVLSMQHQQIPPHLHCSKPTPYINWDELPVSVTTETINWPSGGKRRIAGVSSFGASGTNAHMVLEEAPKPELKTKLTERPLHLLTLSAKTKETLKQLANRYQQHLANNPTLAIENVCSTSNTGRRHFKHRLAVLASSVTELSEKLAVALGSEVPGVLQGHVQSNSQVAFLFTGQGSQYAGMGRQLYETQPTFRAALDRCQEILRSELDKPLLEILYPRAGESKIPSAIDETAYTQPALFALEYALAQLWKSWGVTPDVVMGHSVGEYVAATVAGVFSLEDGLKLIAARGRLMQALPQDGAMVAVLADPVSVATALEPYGQQVAIAAINGPQNLVISGVRQVVAAICDTLKAQGVKTQELQVSHAFHSPLMVPMLADFQQVAAEITYFAPKMKLISNLTGQLVKEEIATPEYWCRHILNPVQFATSLETLQKLGYEVFVEIGAKPTLLGMARQCLPQEGRLTPVSWLPSLRPGQDNWQQMLQSLGELYVRGISVDWSGFDRDYSRDRVALPTYPFQRQRYWIETTEGQQKDRSLLQENVQTPIVNLLNQGDSEQLGRLLAHAGNFSPEKMQLLPELLEVLVKQHQQQLTAASIQDWLYEVEWLALPRQLKTDLKKQELETSSWMVLAHPGGLGQALAKLLLERGQNCILVYPGDAYQKIETGTWSIDPSSPSDFERLFQEALGNGVLPLTGIVHLWSLEAVASELTIPSLERTQKICCGSVLHLVQTLTKHKQSAYPRLWLVTRGAMPLGSALPAVSQAPLWGLGKVVALESPELWGGLLDLAPESTADEAVTLLIEILDSQGEDHLAFREGQRYVARLVRSNVPTSQGVSLRSDSTYLITGGLGALGLQVAQWMVKQGVRHLVLIGRRVASPQTQAIISSMEQAGVEVMVASADVSDQEDMLGLLDQVKATMPPLRGLIHAAGVLDDGMLLQQNWERFSRVMAPKVKGAWNLHVLTQNLQLDFFVCFSSVSSLLGSPGQGNYAAANAFLDALAHYRSKLGLSSLSINWGPWADVGMAASLNGNYKANLADRGISSLKPEQGLKVLEQMLGQTINSQVGVLLIEWLEFMQQFSFGKQPPLSKLIHKVDLKEESEQASAQRLEFLQQLKSAQASEVQELLITHIQGEVARVLGFGQSQLPDPVLNFFDMGMDSLTAVELQNRLQSSLGQSLSSTLIFNYPNINKLSQYLSQEVLALEVTPQKSENSSFSQEEITSLENIQQLSETELMALIAEQFEAHR